MGVGMASTLARRKQLHGLTLHQNVEAPRLGSFLTRASPYARGQRILARICGIFHYICDDNSNAICGTEGNGTVQFNGTYSSITWTNPNNEFAMPSRPGPLLLPRRFPSLPRYCCWAPA